MGTTNPLASLLGRSPFKPMQEHMRTVVTCVQQVPDLFKALENNDRDALNKVKDKIFELENKADDLKNDLRAHLPNSLFMPVARRDLLEILDMQDAIADTAQDIAGLLTLREDLSPPSGMCAQFAELSVRCVATCEKAGEAIEELDELLETGFGGRESELVEKMLKELSDLEDETDHLGIALCQSLFAREDEIKPVVTIMLYQMIRDIGNLGDYAEKVGDRLRLLIAR
ncbi:TIGR00153 family protein [Magnetococcus sp. PR-3]|uniref:TIGR00153 family protein n=1 Tax=Magnetococcus sp. PR-3 TaxID=3120355 RepID=UPI002FCDFD3F